MDNVAAATEDLRVQNERYRVGAATILDLLTSQTALTTAEQNLVQARLDYLVARAQVEAVVGRTL
jgi:outer membrane protein TolC